jgi:predicted GNAT family acetyltransferase
MLGELQRYLRQAAALHREVVRSGPFLIQLSADSAQTYANYAIPDDGAEPTAQEVAALCAAFRERGLAPALEYLPGCAPAVHDALLAGGLRVTGEVTLMTCPAADAVDLAPPNGVAVRLIDDATPEATLRATLESQHAAFGVPDEPVRDGDVLRLRRRASEGAAAYAVAGEEVVGGGVAVAVRDGLSEIAGIGVVEAARRRGIAGALTAALTKAAIDRGAYLPFLTVIDAAAGRVYERAGYAGAERMLHMGAA